MSAPELIVWHVGKHSCASNVTRDLRVESVVGEAEPELIFPSTSTELHGEGFYFLHP